MNKPAAFANYRYRKELFPALIFTKAYDSLQQWYSRFNADKEYLRILYLAATTMECEVETALNLLMETFYCNITRMKKYSVLERVRQLILKKKKLPGQML